MLQCFGAARALGLLRRLAPVRTTHLVEREQLRTAPPHAQAAFRRACDEGWIAFVPPPGRHAVAEVLQAVPQLSRADAELFVLARAASEDLFTDERLLARVAEKHHVQVFDVTDTILLLEELGALDRDGKKRLVLGIHAEDGRVFSESELAVLGLNGFL